MQAPLRESTLGLLPNPRRNTVSNSLRSISAKPLRPRFQYFVHSARLAVQPTGCAKTAQRLRGNRTSTRAEFLTEFRRRRTRQRRDPVAEYDEVRVPCPDAAQPRIRYSAHGGLRAFHDCPIAYVQAIKAADGQRPSKSCRARGAGDICRAVEYR